MCHEDLFYQMIVSFRMGKAGMLEGKEIQKKEGDGKNLW